MKKLSEKATAENSGYFVLRVHEAETDERGCLHDVSEADFSRSFRDHKSANEAAVKFYQKCGGVIRDEKKRLCMSVRKYGFDENGNFDRLASWVFDNRVSWVENWKEILASI